MAFGRRRDDSRPEVERIDSLEIEVAVLKAELRGIQSGQMQVLAKLDSIQTTLGERLGGLSDKYMPRSELENRLGTDLKRIEALEQNQNKLAWTVVGAAMSGAAALARSMLGVG